MSDHGKGLTPKDHAEAVAILRAEIVGALAHRELARGELAAELETLSEKRFRLPDSKITRSYSVPTLQRWYYAYRKGGLTALQPEPRSDRGHAQALTEDQRTLLLDIKREHPAASVPLILRTLALDGRLEKDVVSEIAVRRLYAAHGLNPKRLGTDKKGKTRRRWQAERPNLLWHGDVCHAAPIVAGDHRLPVRIHALLDDASRYILAIEARHTEQESDMLRLLVGALRRHGLPGSLYLDNGSTYRGEILRVACARLGVSLLHAKPYDPEARAKMERFWGTLRRGCLDFLGSVASLHDINVRLFAFVDQHYHRAPHAGLLGRTPEAVWKEAAKTRPADELNEAKLREALIVRQRRRVQRDTTLSVKGQLFEIDAGYLAGAVVTVAYSVLDAKLAPWVEHQGQVHPLHPVDPIKNGKTRRPPVDLKKSARNIAFDPNGAILDRAVGRRPSKNEEDSR